MRRSGKMLMKLGIEPPDENNKKQTNSAKPPMETGDDNGRDGKVGPDFFSFSELNVLNPEWVKENNLQPKPSMNKMGLDSPKAQSERKLVDYSSSVSSHIAPSPIVSLPPSPLKERNLNTIKESTIRNLWPKGNKTDETGVATRAVTDSIAKGHPAPSAHLVLPEEYTVGKEDGRTQVEFDSEESNDSIAQGDPAAHVPVAEEDMSTEDEVTQIESDSEQQQLLKTPSLSEGVLTPFQLIQLRSVSDNERTLSNLMEKNQGSGSSQLRLSTSKTPGSKTSSRKRQKPQKDSSSCKRGRTTSGRTSSTAARKLIADTYGDESSDDGDFSPLEWSDKSLDENYGSNSSDDSSSDAEVSDESGTNEEEISERETGNAEDRDADCDEGDEDIQMDIADDGAGTEVNTRMEEEQETQGGEEEREERQGGEENTEDEDDPGETDSEAQSEDEDLNVIEKRKYKQKLQNKILRNTGKKYIRKTGVVVPARKIKPPHQCKVRNCHQLIKPKTARKIFKEYWAQGTHNKRVSYVCARIECSNIQRRRSRKDEREKKLSYKYFFDVKGERVQVCRSTFMNTLGETDRFMRDAAENKRRSFSGIASDDSRGKHHPKHAMSEEKKKLILDQILSFPAYESHYCRAQTKLLYLSPMLSVKKMHEIYSEEGHPKVSYDTYRRVFKTTGRKFHAPKTDGCNKCDKLAVKIASAEGENKEKLKQIKELHLRKAEMGYTLKRQAKAEAEKDEKKRVLVFDLQQCLPTPHLKCKDVYYSRQLYVYNFTVTDTTTDLTTCYMWNEVEGHRGANEIGSCLLHHITHEIPNGVTHVCLFSDCCAGQNRNSIVATALFAALQEHPTVTDIDHVFLVPGHTFLPEVDSRHSVIEKYKRKVDRINVPSQWYSAVTEAGKVDKKRFPNGKFQVVHKTNFYELKPLCKSLFVKRKQCLDKQRFKYLETQWMRYKKDQVGIVEVKSALNPDAPFRRLSFLRSGQRTDRVPRILDQVPAPIPKSVPITAKKKKDLLKLTKFLEPQYHRFYEELPSKAPVVKEKEYHPDEPEPLDEDSEDGED